MDRGLAVDGTSDRTGLRRGEAASEMRGADNIRLRVFLAVTNSKLIIFSVTRHEVLDKYTRVILGSVATCSQVLHEGHVTRQNDICKNNR